MLRYACICLYFNLIECTITNVTFSQRSNAFKRFSGLRYHHLLGVNLPSEKLTKLLQHCAQSAAQFPFQVDPGQFFVFFCRV